MAANSMLRFSALALAAAGAAAQYVQYNTHQNDDCETVISSSVYMGVPTTEGVLAVDTCLAFEEGLTTFYDSEAANSVGTLSVQYVCNVTTGVLTNTWYSEADCGETDGFVTLDTVQDVCTTTCVEDEPDFGSDEFEDATVTFYEDADCATEVESEAFEVADLYELYGIDGTSCSVSGDFDLYTVLHCAESAPAAVYYEDDECAGDMVGITLNIGCTPVPSTAANGTYPGDYFMAECTEGVAAADDDTAVEEDDDEEEDTEATSGATSPSLVFGGLSGAFAAAVVVATSVAAFF